MPNVSAELRAITDTALGALNRGDLETFLTVVADDVEFTSMIAEVEGQTFRGHDGVRTWWSTVAGAFQEVRWELLELEGSSPRGLAKLRAVAEVDGVEVEQMVWQAASLRDGKLEWWAFFRDEHAARAAAGLWRTDGPASSGRAPRTHARPG
jgi:ketosteroid isomerase-like protein